MDDTSNAPAVIGALAGNTPQNLANLSISTHPNGALDYDWYQWTPAVNGLFTATVTTSAGGPLELHLFTVNSQGTLVALGQDQSSGTTLSVSVTVSANEQVLVEVKGQNVAPGFTAQGLYSLSVQLG